MKSRSIFVVSVVLMIAFAFVIYKYESISQKNVIRKKAIVILNNIHTLNEITNQYFLSKYERPNNDLIQQDIKSFKKYLSEFKALIKNEDDNEKTKDIKKVFDKAFILAYRKDELLQKFITRKAIVINSMRYLPTLYIKIRGLLFSSGLTPIEKTKINIAVANSLSFVFYQLFDEEINAQKFAIMIANLKSLTQYDKEIKKHIHFFIIHIINIYNQKQALLKIVSEEEKISYLSDLIDEIIEKYILFYDSEFEFQNRLNIILFILLFGIVLVLAYVYLQERNYKKRLSALNKTLQQKIDQEVRKRQEKEKMLMNQNKIKAMSELIVSIAHNWRQPINAVGFIVQDIKDAYEHKELDEKYLQNSVDKVMKVLNDLSNMINDFDFLFMKRIKKEKIDLTELLQNLQNIKLRPNHIECILAYDKNEKYTIYAPKSELQEVFIHLVKNSIDAINKKRQKDKNFKAFIKVKIEKTDGILKIIFSDNGIGIDEKIKDRIFEPYFTTKMQGEGVGLGLYVVKTIIENHMNGHVEFYQLNNKTVFEVLLTDVAPTLYP